MNKRLKHIGGHYSAKSFDRLTKQIEGKGMLLVVIINTTCEDCQKIQDFINQLKQGLINKLSNLVVCFGYNNDKVHKEEPSGGDKKKTKDSFSEKDEKLKDQKKLADSNLFSWEALPDGHGYAIFTNAGEPQLYPGEFDHDEFKSNVLTTIRRVGSSVRTLAGLPGKREFVEKKRSGIVVEYASSTKTSEISECEQEVAKYQSKLALPVYFCKGLTAEITLVYKGNSLHKNKGLDLEKFLKKMPKLPQDNEA